MEEIDHLLMGLERAKRFALLVFCDALGQLGVDAAPLCRRVLVAVNNRFWLKYYLAALRGRLKHIAHVDSDLGANALRYDDLEFVFDGYDGHGVWPVTSLPGLNS